MIRLYCTNSLPLVEAVLNQREAVRAKEMYSTVVEFDAESFDIVCLGGVSHWWVIEDGVVRLKSSDELLPEKKNDWLLKLAENLSSKYEESHTLFGGCSVRFDKASADSLRNPVLGVWVNLDGTIVTIDDDLLLRNAKLVVEGYEAIRRFGWEMRAKILSCQTYAELQEITI